MDKRTRLYAQLLDASKEQRETNIAEHKLRTGRIKRSLGARRKLRETKKEAKVSKVPLDFLAIAAKLLAQFALGAFQGFAPAGWQVPAGAIDVEGQHRQRRAVRIGFAPAAAFRRSFQRRRDALWIALGEDAAVEIERIAFARHTRRPAPAARSAARGSAPGRFSL